MTEDFEAAAATVFAAMIKVNIAQTLPHLTQCDRDAVFLTGFIGGLFGYRGGGYYYGGYRGRRRR